MAFVFRRSGPRTNCLEWFLPPTTPKISTNSIAEATQIARAWIRDDVYRNQRELDKLEEAINNSLGEMNSDSSKSACIPSIYVKTIAGHTLTLKNVHRSDSIQSLVNKIEMLNGMVPAHQNLKVGGITLNKEDKVMYYRIFNESTLHVVHRVRGGMDDGSNHEVKRKSKGKGQSPVNARAHVGSVVSSSSLWGALDSSDGN